MTKERFPRQNPGLEAAITAAGSIDKLAAAIGITPAAVSQWQRVPVDRVIAVENATGVSREVLRPDTHPPRRRELEAKQ